MGGEQNCRRGYMLNAYVYYSHVKNKPKRYSFRDFVTKLVIQLGLRFGVNTGSKKGNTHHQ